MSTIRWTENTTRRRARWHSESAAPPPTRVVAADDRMRADTAFRLVRQGTALLWRGSFPNARRLLGALRRRVDDADRAARAAPPPYGDPAEAFWRHRRARAARARLLGRLLVLLEADHSLDLSRAPDVRQACAEAYGPPCEALPGRPTGPTAVALTELLGVISAHQWRLTGVAVAALGGARVHPHYGVFSPTRAEYVDLVARAPLPPTAAGRPAGRRALRRTAFDLGTGTGVLAAVLARRGVGRVVATDISPRALACARENVRRLGPAGTVEVAAGPGLFPDGRADLVVCNPPWLPGEPASEVELGVYDSGGRMLRGFLAGLADHLAPGGEGWLVLSDLAEHLGLRTRRELADAIAEGGLRVVDRIDTVPRHPRARDGADPLHAARSAETTSLWRLAAVG
ncbi:methylase of polypeptide subunit release factors [Streptomonospora nanhaiensis]|uniref:Methylase of polypeptide subunit release factors n=1 Tax=Streptomonospora nanhaiensis TaxID=1323731 RepID=A0A853BRZ2_9ACTN|nr:class I SAM-dependent methyltransferase [Streptomonospora nanhaiensis]NYI97644.1 methylase of polypeptide subunit release factors [Streptomonospora nanhaiensis]